MKSYARIAQKIQTTPWFITEDGLQLVLNVFEARVNNLGLTDEDIAARLNSADDYGNGYASGAIVEDGVGIIPIYGPIFGKANLMTELSGSTSLEMVQNDLNQMLADYNVKSILFDIDSPGGSSEMVESTANMIFSARGIKPITAIANTNAGSAAFWLGTQADKFYATPDGMVGSLGAYTVHEDQSVADAQQGIKYTYIFAGKHKTEGNPHEPLSQEAKEYRQELINELYDGFVGAVARGRGLSADEVDANFGQGRMVPSKRALSSKMIDGIYEFDAAKQSATIKGQSSIAVPVAVLTDQGPVQLKGYMDGKGLITVSLSNADMEHSEPGTGTPPTPRRNDPGQDNGVNGSRWVLPEQFPNEELAPGAPKANANIDSEVDMYPEEIYQLFGIPFNADGSNEGALTAAIRESHTVATSVGNDVSLAGQEAKFKVEYPDMWKQMKEDRAERIDAKAAAFAAKHTYFNRVDGENTIRTNNGLSAFCVTSLEDLYKKFATSTASLADFEAFMDSMFNGGLVQYGELGSTREGDLPEGDTSVNTSTAEGIRAARIEFGNKVKMVQERDGIEYAAAVTQAATEFPKLAAAYRENATVVS